MPSPFTSSFASAAAGNTSSDSYSNGRNTGNGDWSRARTNGATATFRRPSVATGASFSRDGPQSNSNPLPSAGSVYVPPHMSSNYQPYNRNGASTECRYSKDHLLDLYRAQEKSGLTNGNLGELFVDGWTPGVNGTSNGGWGKRDDHKDATGPEICWDHSGNIPPLALMDMTEGEKEAFASSVNSPLKPPTQNTNKDGTPNNSVINRRTSITQNMNNSPSTRPGARRRESGGDLLQNSLISPTSNRFSQEGPNVSSPPLSLLRRKTDHKEMFGASLDDKDNENDEAGFDTTSSFGTLKRRSTQPASAGIGSLSSPWSGAPQSAGFAPMGAFGNFAIGGGASQTPTSSEKKPGFGSLRGESRFKGLMSASSSEDLGSRVKEKGSLSNLARLPESTNEQQQSRWAADRNAPPRSSNADLYGDEDEFPGTGGSAALGGDDASPPVPLASRYRNPDRQTSYDEIGFSSMNLGNDMLAFQHREYAQQQTPQARKQGISQMNEPMSPTTTNPYQSPEGPKSAPEDNDTDESDLHHMQYAGGAQYGQPARGFHNQLDDAKGDRSQTSSRGGGRAYPGLVGLGNLSGLGGGPWSAAPGAIGTPSRAQPSYSTAFGDTAFGPMNDLTSPQSGLNGGGFFGAGGAGPGGRGSKLSALLPNALQEQMRNDISRQEQGYNDNVDAFQRNSSHDAPGFGLRESESSSRLTRGGMEDLFANSETRSRALQSLTSSFAVNDQNSSGQATLSAAVQTPFSAGPPSGSYFARSLEQELSSSQMPASQQRQMVMPDRMRWIYRDPQGNTQGPWSGLEMHDWYKAGFFSPELQVKKLEDADYEPLAQLIRRIGNSREPFLVPQIGIPHGSSTAQASSAAATVGAIPATTPSAAQPPFASSFPSFGTTLSAEQQNALERRKQEEQYLMARQKEHLAQQQLALKQMQHIAGGQLHHHSSAHSLQSQPSYGSITSPMGYQPSPAQGPIQPPGSTSGSGFFEGLSRGAGPLGADVLGSVREEDMPGFMERFNNMGRGGQLPFSQDGQAHQQHVAAIIQERARQQREQEQYDMLRQGTDDQRIAAERLEQYNQLRAQEEMQQQYQQPTSVGGIINRQISEMDLQAQQQRLEQADYHDQIMHENQKHSEPPSLSEQVQKAAAKQTSSVQPQSPWAKIDIGMPQPFPPPQSQSPMPAPTPQRNRQSVADALNAESQSPSRTESTDTPSAAIAPWAKETTEGAKGPSLKEIQAMEAKKAAQQEEIVVAARRALAEQERVIQQNQAIAPAPGLPSSANWASSVSPVVPATTTATSAWAKPATGKPDIAIPVAGAKKTLAQIQREEEARKTRLAAAATANTANNAPTPTATGGKRYADLASKAAASVQSVNSPWTTVGASGKVKTPITPAPGLSTRTASGGIVQPTAAAIKSKTTLSSAAKGPGSQQHANEEFQKWTKSALSKGLNSNISVDSFVTELLLLPPDAEIISDSIYASSQTLDGRRFAEEFVRRRKLADRGIVPDSSNTSGFSSPSNANDGKGSGGWSEVAKKGPANAKEESNSAFKVVAGKKKGAKR